MKNNIKNITLNILTTQMKFSNKFSQGGLQLNVSGRLRGSLRTKRIQLNYGRISTQTIKSSLQSNKKQIYTKWGTFGSTIYISRVSP